MFEQIGTFLTQILDFFKMLWDFVSGLISDVVELTTLLVDASEQLPNYLSFLPSSISGALLVLLGIVVLYKILGREG